MARHSRGGTTRSVKRGPKNNLWTAVLYAGTQIALGAQNTSLIVTQDDWIRAAAGNERCTILRVRGTLSIAHEEVAATAAGAVQAYAMVEDEDVTTTASPFVAATYAEEDILWTNGIAWPTMAANTVVSPVHWVIDIKAMRRIQRDQELKMVIANGAAGRKVVVNGVIRALLRLGGN